MMMMMMMMMMMVMMRRMMMMRMMMMMIMMMMMKNCLFYTNSSYVNTVPYLRNDGCCRNAKAQAIAFDDELRSDINWPSIGLRW